MMNWFKENEEAIALVLLRDLIIALLMMIVIVIKDIVTNGLMPFAMLGLLIIIMVACSDDPEKEV